MWNEPRKSYRSPQKTTNPPQPTPGKAQKASVRYLTRQCPLHFNEPTHICFTCRKSICLRCALTYCQQHVIRSESEALLQLREEVIKLQVCPKMDEIMNKLEQSKQRQEYLQKKVLRLIQSIQQHFDYISQMLAKKKLQIIQFYDQQFQRYLQEHRNFDQEMKQRYDWLAIYALEEGPRPNTIEEIDQLSSAIKKYSLQDAKIEKKITKLLMGKDRIRIEKMWSEQNLEKVLFEVENIQFKMEQKIKGSNKRKKRLTTQNMNQRQQTIGNVKSSSNSRFPSSRKIVTQSN